MAGIVIAIGGNAISDPSTIGNPRSESASIRRVAREIAQLYLKRNRIVVTHGNGPQVGRELQRNELAAKAVPELPLYLLTAETESVIGSVISTALSEELLLLKQKPEVCTVISHVMVERGKAPRKPVGNFMSASQLRTELRRLKFEYIRKGNRYRRVVPSPRPTRLLESDMIKSLSANGIVVAGGGGGVPMVSSHGRYHGVDAVVDKDLTSALLAHDMKADILIILTDTDYLYSGAEGRGNAIKRISARTLSRMVPSLEEGTIRPKVEACLNFVRGGGKAAYIGNLYRLKEILNGSSGTKITK